MGSQYAGDADNFPDDYTIPDDSDPPFAASHNVAHEALGDRTAYLKARVDPLVSVQALNWIPRTAMGTVNEVRKAVYDAKSRTWYAVSPDDANKVFRSTTDGIKWTDLAATLSAIGGAPSEDCWDVDIDPEGNVVVAQDGSGDVYAFDGAAWTVENVSVDTHEVPAVVYSPVHDQWCIVQRPGAAGAVTPKVYTSTDRSTWTQRTSPFTELAYEQALLVNKTSGRMFWIIAYLDGVLKAKCAVSDDAGVTWGGVVTIAATGGTFSGSSVSIDQDTGIVYIPFITAALGTNLYRSDDDGATFDLACALADERLARVVGIGNIVVATALGTGGAGTVLAESDLVYSVDRGETWIGGGMRFDSEAGSNKTLIFDGGGGFMAFVQGGAVFRSVRGGTPGQVLT
jgi:hypothetical protein